jgi:hypothetical protein
LYVEEKQEEESFSILSDNKRKFGQLRIMCLRGKRDEKHRLLLLPR